MTYIAENLIEVKLNKLELCFELKRFSTSYELHFPVGYALMNSSVKKICEVLESIEWDLISLDDRVAICIPFKTYDPITNRIVPNIGL